MANPTAEHLRVRERVRELVKEEGSQGWDKAWLENATPWDAGKIQPPLREVMESGEVDFKTTGRALVPGCGGGYDAIYLGTLGFETTGLDISPTALEIARQRVPEGVNVRFEQHDFFSLKVSEEEKFDLVYDYTFFCAIPRNLHAGWGSQMRQLVKPGGYLITLVFPIVPEPEILNGPPWPVRPSLYDEPLQGPQGGEWDKVVDRVPNTSVPGHIDHEHLIVWRKL